MNKTITLPFISEQSFDVIVVGGGITGICAAVAAARTGVSVGLVEKNAFLGGVAVMGLPWLGFHDANFRRIIGGIPYEIIHALQQAGDASSFFSDPICNSAVMTDAVALRATLHRLAEGNGIHIAYHTIALPTPLNGEHLQSVILANKQGLLRWNARTFVDATDSGDIAAAAGAKWIFGREKDGRSQVSSVVLTVGNIDMDKMLHYFEQHPDQIRPFPMNETTIAALLAQMKTAPGFILGAFPTLVKQARADGIQYHRDYVIGAVNRQKRQMTLVTGRVEQVNPNDEECFSQAEGQGIGQIEGTLQLLRGYIPGFEHCITASVGHQLGVRETRHIQGVYVLKADDLLQATAFEDTIALGAYHLDVHSPDHDGLDTHKPPIYSIPYRCLLPAKPDNVFLSGRTISATHEAQSSTRVMPIAGAIGQAAGCAAGLCAKENLAAQDLPYPLLQETLLSQDAILVAADNEEEPV